MCTIGIKFLGLRGGIVCAKTFDKSHRRSPIVQGGLEIPVQVTAEMDLTERNLEGLEDDHGVTDEEIQSNTVSEI